MSELRCGPATRPRKDCRRDGSHDAIVGTSCPHVTSVQHYHSPGAAATGVLHGRLFRQPAANSAKKAADVATGEPYIGRSAPAFASPDPPEGWHVRRDDDDERNMPRSTLVPEAGELSSVWLDLTAWNATATSRSRRPQSPRAAQNRPLSPCHDEISGRWPPVSIDWTTRVARQVLGPLFGALARPGRRPTMPSSGVGLCGAAEPRQASSSGCHAGRKSPLARRPG
jgi:hypothetical protein